jgi:hypothetical protein
MSLFKSVKCFFGFHIWEYSLGEIYTHTVRFCPRCYKKQIRHRHDIRIFWLDTELSSDERRDKRLKYLLDKT